MNRDKLVNMDLVVKMTLENYLYYFKEGGKKLTT